MKELLVRIVVWLAFRLFELLLPLMRLAFKACLLMENAVHFVRRRTTRSRSLSWPAAIIFLVILALVITEMFRDPRAERRTHENNPANIGDSAPQQHVVERM
jgi:hypothetical protein